ncbi:MAG: DUF488 family protein [Firmicutes bacterium]|uniref:Uncharacterized conserved protein YeaO, DUF488 family n=1 Tax=Melghirimyces thermohalophilus TaxID=1236220 RepID=A0A1G6HMD1_9BACL|nr:DUF488 family protein [Melghirimyces thermohalophilus]MDA8353876.1 DUF488 family protein [Bacillota bacterium]SDB94606.1 Uncharacterized conserved protein YeaO, DUF488 family [Melghirimyces thermohalophilus]
MKIRTKRVYEPPSDDDGIRVLVDRLWPRGLSKEKARIDLWAKALAPSSSLRKRFHQDQDYDAFQRDYRDEIDPEELDRLMGQVEGEPVVTLLFASKNKWENNAQVLKQLMQEKS